MNLIARTVFCLLAVLASANMFAAPDRETLVSRIVNSEYVLEEIMASSDTSIPSSILNEAKGMIFTISYRGGFFIGAHGGSGVILVKNPLNGEWGVPAFVKTGGANLGFQIGVKEVDTVYVLMDENTVRDAIGGRFNLGADASAVAGPRGVVNEAEGRDYKQAKILVYTTTKGLFAGVSVKAGWVAPDARSTKAFYNTNYSVPEVVLSDWFDMPREAQSLVERLNFYMEGGR